MREKGRLIVLGINPIIARTPLPDARFLDTLVVRASYVRDGETLQQDQPRLIHRAFLRADLARDQVAAIDSSR
jgi:hypothetical protein